MVLKEKMRDYIEERDSIERNSELYENFQMYDNGAFVPGNTTKEEHYSLKSIEEISDYLHFKRTYGL